MPRACKGEQQLQVLNIISESQKLVPQLGKQFGNFL